MRFAANLKSGSSVHKLDLDVRSVEMTEAQRAIAAKLFEKVKDQEIDLDKKDPCEEGHCLASAHLSADEFAQIRGLKAKLGTQITPEWVIIDFCIHPIIHKN